VSDLERRHFERRGREGDLSGRVHALRERFREGSLDLERLMLAAYSGDAAAFEALDFEGRCELLTHEGNTILGKKGPVDPEIVKRHARLGTRVEIDRDRWLEGLQRFGPIASAHAAVALAEAALPPGDPRTGPVLAYARRWLARPAIAIEEPFELPALADPIAHALVQMLSGSTVYRGVMVPYLGVPDALVRSVADPLSVAGPAVAALALAPERPSFEYQGVRVESTTEAFRRGLRLGARDGCGRSLEALAFWLPENGDGHKSRRVREIIASSRRSVDHPGVQRLERSVELSENSFLFVYAANGPATSGFEWQPGRSVDETRELVLAVAAALEEAHRLGVVHGRLDPASVVVTGGKPLVRHFAHVELSELCVHLSDSGFTFVGVPLYFAPEAYGRREDRTESTDIYSLAAVASFLFTGKPPFEPRSYADIFSMVRTAPPRPVRELRPGVPARLERALLRALAKKPEDRFPDMASFRAELAAR
jgi:hypothetical protein